MNKTWARLTFKPRTIIHPREFRSIMTTLTKGKPWYATANAGVIQHLAPSIFQRVTYCGRYAASISNCEERTMIGWTCTTCKRRAKRYQKRMLAAGGDDEVPPMHSIHGISNDGGDPR